MATIHFLNVRSGDCSIIEHDSGHNTVIDICNATAPGLISEAMSPVAARADQGIGGNFQQKNWPVNPISYMGAHNITGIHRYVQTHPDMDHMDGLQTLFENFSPVNFWDTDNKKEMPATGWEGSQYRESDWRFYKRLRDSDRDDNPIRLTLYSGSRGEYYNQDRDGTGNGDGLNILAPTKELIAVANEVDKEYNRCSYVILYQVGDQRIVFGGDSHDDTWDHILRHHRGDITNIDLLIAPHHGRKSDRSYEFLETLKPTLTFFGNAPSEYLAYSAWRDRGLSFLTNNQANCMVVDASTTPMNLYVTHENFARRINSKISYNTAFRAWHVGPITEDLIP